MKPLRPSHHTFRGKEFCIRWRPPTDTKNVGECQDPKFKRPSIVIHPDLQGLEKLITIVDEIIHACDFDKDNDAVGEMSGAMGSFLWECGLRFKDEIINQALAGAMADAILPPLK